MNLKKSFLSTILLLPLLATGCAPEAGDSSATASGDEVERLAAGSFKDILLEPDRLTRVDALIDRLQRADASDAKDLEAAIRNRNLPLREIERVLIVSRWAQLDPAAATEWALLGTSGELRRAATREAAFRWASVDPEALIQAHDIEKMATGVPELVVGLVEGWHQSGKPGLDDYIVDLGRGETRQRAIDARVRLEVRDRPPQEVMEWARGRRGDREYRQSIFSRVGAELVEVDPKWSVQWCDEVCETQPGKQVANLIGPRWAEFDGPAAMAWLFTRPDEVETWATIRAAYRRYLIADKPAALAWFLDQDRSLYKEQRYQGPLGMVINEFAWRDGEKAAELVPYLTHPRERKVALITIARRWLIRDPEGAEAWLPNSSLTEEQIAEAREIPANSPAARRAKNYKDRDERRAEREEGADEALPE